MHNRGLFWELIQEEAETGVTVFVTTHFLEEADYCDWVCFIDAGRLIADATPEELRRRYSEGYRIDDRAARRGARRRRARALARARARPSDAASTAPHRGAGLDAEPARRRSAGVAA